MLTDLLRNSWPGKFHQNHKKVSKAGFSFSEGVGYSPPGLLRKDSIASAFLGVYRRYLLEQFCRTPS